MDLLTIACDRDFYLMDTQAKSIQKFVAPCTHWIFVNQTKMDRQKWIDFLSPYYTNHKLEFVFTDDIEPFEGVHGYNTQQYWKLTAVDIIKTDYVIIDTKNIFVRDTDLTTWTHEGSGVYGYILDTDPGETFTGDSIDVDNGCHHARDYYSKYFGLPKINKFFNICTPFIARKNVMEEVSALIRKDNVFLETDLSWHADFMIYSMIGEKYGILDKEHDHLPEDINSKTIFFHGIDWDYDCSNGVNRIKQNPHYACISLHHTWTRSASHELREEMTNFLDSLGVLENNLKTVLLDDNKHEAWPDQI